MPPSLSVRQTPSRVVNLQFSPLPALLRLPPVSCGPGAGKEPAAPPVRGIKEAQTLIQAGRFEGALAILGQLARACTGDTNVTFLIGLAAHRSSAGFPKIDATNCWTRRLPPSAPCWCGGPSWWAGGGGGSTWIARAFFLKGDDKLARRHFEQVSDRAFIISW